MEGRVFLEEKKELKDNAVNKEKDENDNFLSFLMFHKYFFSFDCKDCKGEKKVFTSDEMTIVCLFIIFTPVVTYVMISWGLVKL